MIAYKSFNKNWLCEDEKSSFTKIKYLFNQFVDLKKDKLAKVELTGSIKVEGCYIYSENIRIVEELYYKDYIVPFADLIRCDLRKLDLSNMDLRGADFSYCDLFSVNLSGSNLSGAKFLGANLQKAKLKDCNFEGADLRSSRLLYTNMTKDLADFFNCRYSQNIPDFRGRTLCTIFAETA